MPHDHHDASADRATELWLEATWPFVQSELPEHPATVLEIGCGPYGGFVPRLLRQGHHAVGVDPDAPQGEEYFRTEYERFEHPAQLDVVVASASLHHVADLGQVFDRVRADLKRQGSVIVVEWALERFDEATAQWCFERLAPHGSEDEPGWLERHRDQWQESGQSWDAFFQSWKHEGSLHDSQEVLLALDARFDRRVYQEVPYFFPSLAGTTRADEQAAIDTSKIQAGCIQYAAEKR